LKSGIIDAAQENRYFKLLDRGKLVSGKIEKTVPFLRQSLGLMNLGD